jgi:predicted CXXCH cytochrome family protein
LARRIRTAKKLAQRVDMNYFKQAHGLRRWRFFLAIAAVVVAAIWVLSFVPLHTHHAYSPGVVAEVHTIFAEKCELCHLPEGKGVSARMLVSDKACLSCHDGPRHGKESPVGTCTGCHLEHRGIKAQLVAVSENNCVSCHKTMEPAVMRFNTNHPEFPELKNPDPGTINLNHKVHMGAKVGATCDTCHHPSDAPPCKPKGSVCGRPSSTYAFMAPLKYADNCASCHDSTSFNTTFGDAAPHDTPENIDAWFAKTHGGEAAKIANAEQQLWKNSCTVCHIDIDFSGGKFPKIQAAQITTRWYKKANFSHDAHRSLDCLDCHNGIPTSEKTADVNLPGLKVCENCHKPEHAESRCFECHVYHEWPREKTIEGKVKLNQVVGVRPKWMLPLGEVTPPAARP